MKKLMIAAALVASAIFANAASVDWAANCDQITGSAEEGGYDGYAVYIFSGDQAARDAMVASLSTGLGGLSSALEPFEESYPAVDYDYFDIMGATKIDSYTGSDDAEWVSAYAVILNAADAANATAFYATDAQDIKVTSGVEKGGAAFAYGTIEITSSDWTSVAPEPTSGLLLLVGVAGLALRRRRA